MRVTVRYEDGSIEEFDTSTLTTESALGRPNALTDIHITIGDGVWADLSWYRVPTASSDGLATRLPGCRIHLLNGEELAHVRSIELEGRLQWLRVGDDLCDVTRLDEISDLMHEGPSTSIASRAVWLHDTLLQVLPTRRDSHEHTCLTLGLSPSSYEILVRMGGYGSSGDDAFPA